MIETFRTDDSIRTRATRLHQLNKLANQTDPLHELRDSNDFSGYVYETVAVSTYAHAYLDALRDNPEAVTHAHDTTRLDTSISYAWSYALACRNESEAALEEAKTLRDRALGITV